MALQLDVVSVPGAGHPNGGSSVGWIRYLGVGCTAIVACLLLIHSVAYAATEQRDAAIRRALRLKPHPNVGGMHYRNYCATCHGLRGAGNKTGMPSLAGQRVAYLVKQIADFAQENRDDGTMHRVAADKALSSPQTWIDMAAYLNALPPAVAGTGDGKKLDLGEGIYREECSSCHGADARGDDEGFIPSLRQQHYAYLLDQLNELAATHRRNIDPDLNSFFASFPPDERKATADYLSRMADPTQNR